MDSHPEDQAEYFKRKKDAVMKFLKKIIVLFILQLASVLTFAQDKKTEMADTMRSNGRIYVVVAVVVTILVGLILYVIRIDRKLSKLEKNAD